MSRKYKPGFYLYPCITLLMLGGAFACQHPETDPLFDSVASRKSGIHFSNDLSENEEFNLIEYLYFYNGGGVALGDINNDGLVDVYLSANQQDNKLYLNKGNWKFEDITQKAGVAAPGQWKTGITMADVNGDGWLDIYQCRLGGYKGIEGKNQLFINNGDLTFTERAEAFNLDFKGFSTQSAFLDVDLDGDLDMYLLNHSVHTERSYGRAALRRYDDPKAGDRLYRNDNGQFVPLSSEAGIYSSQIGYGLGVGVSDVNADGWPDLYISNDFNENDYLYLNTRNTTGEGPVFQEVINQAIGHTSRFSMGNDLADYNNDGLIDLISLDMLPEDEIVLKRSAGDDSYEIYNLKLQFGYGRQFTRNALQLNTGILPNGTPTFSEIGQLAGVHATDWSWSALFADFDNDGWKDLFISNGIRRRPNDMDYINFLSNKEIQGGLKNNPDLSDKRLVDEMPDGAVPNYLFRNKGDLTFQSMNQHWGMTTPSLSNGAAYADLDNDGDLDLVVNNINQTASLYRNHQNERSPSSAGYLKIIPKGTTPNPFGVGATVVGYANTQTWLLENYPTRGFQSSVPPVLHLGTGNVQKLDSLRIVWPGGKTQRLLNVSTRQTLTLDQADAQETYIYAQPVVSPLLKPVPELASSAFKHVENDFNDFNSAFLLPHKISREGPPIAVADVNGDGLEDYYIGNAAGSDGALFIQTHTGFQQTNQPVFNKNTAQEETDCLFFDANNDGFPDLYIVTAGNTDTPGIALQDRLLLNNGKGQFTDYAANLPEMAQHGAVVAAGDIDQDGDLDLFVGGRSVPAKYGIAPNSYLLLNDGKGRFTDHTSELAPALHQIGMVTDARWVNVNADQWPELLLVGEWMPITLFKNQNGRLQPGNFKGLEYTNGWWNCIEMSDIDEDGDIDFILGNQGENTRHRPSTTLPLHLYAADYDANGSLDPILAYATPRGVFPLPTKDELIKQVPSFRKKFVQHQQYAGQTVQQILGKTNIDKSLHLQATTFASVVVEQTTPNTFTVRKLPLQAQFTPIEAILATDLNADGHTDLLMGGNNFSSAPYFGTYDAGKGLVLLGDGKGGFKPISQTASGWYIPGEIKAIKRISYKGNMQFIIGQNNDKPLFYVADYSN